MPIYRINNQTPSIHSTVYISSNATIIGNVTIGENSSIWFNCVLRGDCDAIIIGKNTNIQDMTMCHEDYGKPLTIGDGVTIGHQCVVHGCTIEDECLIGMGSIVMNGARIGRGSIIAAGSVILENTEIPPFSLVAGIPGKIKRQFDESVLELIKLPADNYSQRALDYASDKLEKIEREICLF
ncbi:MAG: gamma carbonic anhydrase family protein [Desulfamplus sp.]|nr:gamma carbonic anhydrase family protein [Desulfamplus sp.]